MSVRGTDLVADNIIRYGAGFLKTVNSTMKTVAVIIDNQVHKNMSLEDHSLKELKAMGHPYAKRHGEKGIQIHNPYWQVHKRSGELIASKERGTNDANIKFGSLKASAYVRLDDNKAEHAKYIIFGTSKMIPRPLLIGSLNQVKNRAFDVIKENLRDLTARFVAR